MALEFNDCRNILRDFMKDERLEYRVPTSQEFALLRKLLEPEFPGKAEFVAQLTDILVCPIDEAGGLSLKVKPLQEPHP